MNVDKDQPHTTAAAAAAKALQALTAGPLSSSAAKLAASSRCIPSERDFHFYRNFEEFKVPVEEIALQSQSMLEAIGAAAASGGAFPADVDDAYDWLVNVNDDVLERFDASADEFRRVRAEEEATGRPNEAAASMEEDGFELVKKKKGSLDNGNKGENVEWWSDPDSKVHIAVGCDFCGMYPIIGDRYRCIDCKEKMGFDLCSECYDTRSKRPGRFNQQHTSEHRFKLVPPNIIRNIMLRLVTGQLGDSSVDSESLGNLEFTTEVSGLSDDGEDNQNDPEATN